MSENLFKRTGSDDFPKHLKCLVSGPPKSGKTSLLGTMPGIIVLDTEPNANNLESIAHLNVPYVEITNSDDLRQVLFMLGDDTLRRGVANQFGWPDVQGVAIDTLDTLQQILKKERMKEQRSNQFTMQDWGWLKTEMETIVQSFTELPMHVVFVVHTKTQDLGKGDDSYTITVPGLEGGIANSIAGMVGYSMLAFRKEDVMPDGSVRTNYYLRTEGDGTHDYLGTRTAGRLPTIIEPNLKVIYDAVMQSRQEAQDSAPDPQPVLPEIHTTDEVAQSEGQPEEVQTSVETPEEAAPTSEPEVQEEVQPEVQAKSDDRPGGDEPINAAALGHVKRVYDSLGWTFPEGKIVEKMTIGEARQIVMMWRGAQQDELEGKLAEGRTAVQEMAEYLNASGWGGDVTEKEPETESKIDGTIDQVKQYVGSDLKKAQEAYDLESARGDEARATLIKWLESVGAKPVTSAEPAADAVATDDEAVRLLEDKLDAEVVSEDTPKCEECGGEIDDRDLADLGLKRFNKLLCVKDYLAQKSQ